MIRIRRGRGLLGLRSGLRGGTSFLDPLKPLVNATAEDIEEYRKVLKEQCGTDIIEQAAGDVGPSTVELMGCAVSAISVQVGILKTKAAAISAFVERVEAGIISTGATQSEGAKAVQAKYRQIVDSLKPFSLRLSEFVAGDKLRGFISQWADVVRIARQWEAESGWASEEEAHTQRLSYYRGYTKSIAPVLLSLVVIDRIVTAIIDSSNAVDLASYDSLGSYTIRLQKALDGWQSTIDKMEDSKSIVGGALDDLFGEGWGRKIMVGVAMLGIGVVAWTVLLPMLQGWAKKPDTESKPKRSSASSRRRK